MHSAAHPAAKARKQKSLAKCHYTKSDGAGRSSTLTPPHSNSRTATESLAQPRGASSMQTPVLVLNASYEPINICGARRAGSAW